jgi:hypothetical protein
MARLVAVACALLAIPLALINWIDVGRGVYISGRSSDVIIKGGDGYLIVALSVTVLVARVMRTLVPRLVLFPWVCMVCGIGITLVSGRVLFEDWAGDRMWTLYTLFVLGTVMRKVRRRPRVALSRRRRRGTLRSRTHCS